jgi:hypothetical protein
MDSTTDSEHFAADLREMLLVLGWKKETIDFITGKTPDEILANLGPKFLIRLRRSYRYKVKHGHLPQEEL